MDDSNTFKNLRKYKEENNLCTKKDLIKIWQTQKPDFWIKDQNVPYEEYYVGKKLISLFKMTDVNRVKEFLDDLGIKSSGLEKLIAASYSLLGLISYITAGEMETRAWTITKGTKAPGAAGKIHTDFEKGFIRADVVSYDNLVAYGGYNQAKEAGKVRSEGKDYVVQDGDVMLFKFNV